MVVYKVHQLFEEADLRASLFITIARDIVTTLCREVVTLIGSIQQTLGDVRDGQKNG
jgi:hypothetical protein